MVFNLCTEHLATTLYSDKCQSTLDYFQDLYLFPLYRSRSPGEQKDYFFSDNILSFSSNHSVWYLYHSEEPENDAHYNGIKMRRKSWVWEAKKGVKKSRMHILITLCKKVKKQNFNFFLMSGFQITERDLMWGRTLFWAKL